MTRLASHRYVHFAALIATLFTALVIGPMTTVRAQGSLPNTFDKGAHYLFYMHSGSIEKQGLNTVSRKYGKAYELGYIFSAFRKRSFLVIGVARTEVVRPGPYSQGVAPMVNSLMAAVVPPGNITVAGHSKGALMSWLVSSFVGNSTVNYVITASCPPRGTTFRRSFNRFLRRGGTNVSGRILSMYDSADNIADSCSEVFSAAANVTSKEIVFETGNGHGLFYTPRELWINAVNS